MIRFPVKAYAVIYEGDITVDTPRTTLQGKTYNLVEEDLKNWDAVKQKIITEFLTGGIEFNTPWAKGDKGIPTGRPEWRRYVKVLGVKPKLPIEVESRVKERRIFWEPDITYTEHLWRGRPAYAIRRKGRFVTWGFRKE